MAADSRRDGTIVSSGPTVASCLRRSDVISCETRKTLWVIHVFDRAEISALHMRMTSGLYRSDSQDHTAMSANHRFFCTLSWWHNFAAPDE